MKTLKILFLGIVLILAGCSKSDEFPAEQIDLKSAENGAGYIEHSFLIAGQNDYWLDVICDGEVIDVLYGDGENLTIHVITHYIYDEVQWIKFHVKGSLKSELTGVTYALSEQDKAWYTPQKDFYYLTAHTNALGDEGSHYLITVKIVWPVGPDGIIWAEGQYVSFEAKCF